MGRKKLLNRYKDRHLEEKKRKRIEMGEIKYLARFLTTNLQLWNLVP